MKTITLFKSFLAIGVTTAGITSAVVFSNINNVPAPYARVLTKKNYNAIKSQQGGVSNTNINYATLPTSSKTIVDLLTTNYSTDEAFMFTVGSQAYANTNLLLNGIEKDWDNGGNFDANQNSSSLMLKLYDLFYGSGSENSKLAKINMSFYSYIDIVATTEYHEALKILTQRRTTMGDLPPDVPTHDNTGSNQWNVLNDKGRTDPTNPNLQPVVRDGAKFIYYPNPDAFYEFRKDNKHDTEYEKIYYRNDAKTKEYIDTTAWMNTYSNNFLKTTFAREASLMCAKYDATTKGWVFKSFLSPDDYKGNGLNTAIRDIEAFYLD